MEGFYQAHFLAGYENFSEQKPMALSRLTTIDKLEVIYVFANIPYLLVVHRPHKLGGHNYR